MRHLAHEGGVRGVCQAADDLKPAIGEQRERRVAIGGRLATDLEWIFGQFWYPFRRVQKCPVASSGAPHMGHGGRPAWTTAIAPLANSSAAFGGS